MFIIGGSRIKEDSYLKHWHQGSWSQSKIYQFHWCFVFLFFQLVESIATSDMLPIYNEYVMNTGTNSSIEWKGEETPPHLPIFSVLTCNTKPEAISIWCRIRRADFALFCSQLPCVTPEFKPMGGLCGSNWKTFKLRVNFFPSNFLIGNLHHNTHSLVETVEFYNFSNWLRKSAWSVSTEHNNP